MVRDRIQLESCGQTPVTDHTYYIKLIYSDPLQYVLCPHFTWYYNYHVHVRYFQIKINSDIIYHNIQFQQQQ